MSCFIISGGKSLCGEITVGGSKNAVLPIIFATVAARGVSVIENVPDITDVEAALAMISVLGARVTREGTTLTVDTGDLVFGNPPPALTERIRASTYLMGASLARFGAARLPSSGGCNFEPRPIDLHIYAFGCMGAVREGMLISLLEENTGEVRFPKISVGATANALILASSLSGQTRIFGYAKEPHITALAEFLISAGARISFSDECITVVGSRLHGGSIRIPPDPVECGTYALVSLLTGGEVLVNGADEKELASLVLPLEYAGAEAHFDRGSLLLSGSLRSPVSFEAAPYPALPTDLQPTLAPTLGAFFGGEIRDTVFPKRFGYIDELCKFGLSAEYGGGRAVVYPSEYHCAEARAPDLRGGAALILAALAAKGESLIGSAETVMRGYGGIVSKLRSVGADIYEMK